MRIRLTNRRLKRAILAPAIAAPSCQRSKIERALRVTSPPYFGLRDYGMAGQIGLEVTPDDFVAELVAVFAEVRRVLRADGTVWLNLGDSYASTNQAGRTSGDGTRLDHRGVPFGASKKSNIAADRMLSVPMGMKQKDLIGVPWLAAFALRNDGWYLRQDIIWSKPNPMPESVRDRCTKAHEYIFMLSKAARYHYDADAIAEPFAATTGKRTPEPTRRTKQAPKGANKRPGRYRCPSNGAG